MNHTAIYKTHSNVAYINGDDDNLEAFDKDGNKVEINMDLVNAWKDPDEYKENRRSEYPSIVDQLDVLYHGGYDAWKASIKSIKDKYPKGV